MIYKVPEFDPAAPAIVIGIGNTTTSIATWFEEQLKTPLSVPTKEEKAFGEALDAHLDAMPKGRVPTVIIGSVVPHVLSRIRSSIETMLGQNVLVIGEAVSLPMDVAVADRTALGVDRVCSAAAAYEQLNTSCVVVDFGTAVTVDLIDEDGTFLGGAILPGLHMQMQALHEHAAQLPGVQPGVPDLPYGRSTEQAIQVGVCRGLAGAVRGLVEGYATFLKRWPHVVATGGDLNLLAPLCDFIDSRVDRLALRGIGIAYRKHLRSLGA